jgi:YjbE family integral membrane protein
MNFGELTTVEFWVRSGAIMMLNLALSGDNALVIALAVRNLPRQKAWQGRLWGTVAAVVLRVVFTAVVMVLLRTPFLQAVGGAVLLWVAIKLLTQEEGSGQDVRHGTTLFEAIWIIMVADIIMSLDNVLAVAAAAGGDILLIVLGVALSIPIVVFGAVVLSWVMDRLPWIVDLAAGYLGWLAGEMMLADPAVRAGLGQEAVETLRWAVPATLGVGVIAAGRWWIMRRTRSRREAPTGH